MKLSVIVPAYNLENYIQACLTSVLEQDTDFDFEVIVCDDCSSDNTAAKIRELVTDYPERLKSIFKQSNAGLAENMLTLLDAAQGEYLAYLDGDDLALPGKLQQQVNYLNQHPDCHMVFHESDMFDSDTDKSIKLYSQQHYNWEHIPSRSSIEHLIRYGTYMQASSVMFRRHAHLLETVARDCKIILDYPFYLLNAGYLNANIDFMPEVLGRYRMHQSSFGAQTSRSFERREQSLADIEFACRQAKRFNLPTEIISQGVCHHRFAAALYFLQRDEFDLFNKYICLSATEGCFFNQRHKRAWELRDAPQQAKALLVAA